ncbi:MAG TPA: hypothetical protein VHN80_27935 [Kineosporiaceae bacterium]|nr:hypothetical protein [Kineosporiaceae bacterium]
MTDLAVPLAIIGMLFIVLVIDGLPKQDRQYGKRATGGPERPNLCEHPHGQTHIQESVNPPRVNGPSAGTWGMGRPCRH